MRCKRWSQLFLTFSVGPNQRATLQKQTRPEADLWIIRAPYFHGNNNENSKKKTKNNALNVSVLRCRSEQDVTVQRAHSELPRFKAADINICANKCSKTHKRVTQGEGGNDITQKTFREAGTLLTFSLDFQWVYQLFWKWKFWATQRLPIWTRQHSCFLSEDA